VQVHHCLTRASCNLKSKSLYIVWLKSLERVLLKPKDNVRNVSIASPVIAIAKVDLLA
jgi:hypothetical protein